MPPKLTLRIIRPSSYEKNNELPIRIKELEGLGIKVLHDAPLRDRNTYPFTAGSIDERLAALVGAVCESESDAVLCARGGFGASDLLPLIPWELMKEQKPKFIVGFSDISALHSGFFAKLGWPGIHGPMPGGEYWDLKTRGADIRALLDILTEPKNRCQKIEVRALPNTSPRPERLEGWLFGGCLSVLTNLIGTPYLPSSLAGAILFFEDVGEHPGRLLRHLNQWVQAGKLKGVRAIVLGQFIDCKHNNLEWNERMTEEFAKRTAIPVFKSELFGHGFPNFPLLIGAKAEISGQNILFQL